MFTRVTSGTLNPVEAELRGKSRQFTLPVLGAFSYWVVRQLARVPLLLTIFVPGYPIRPAAQGLRTARITTMPLLQAL